MSADEVAALLRQLNELKLMIGGATVLLCVMGFVLAVVLWIRLGQPDIHCQHCELTGEHSEDIAHVTDRLEKLESTPRQATGEWFKQPNGVEVPT